MYSSAKVLKTKYLKHCTFCPEDGPHGCCQRLNRLNYLIWQSSFHKTQHQIHRKVRRQIKPEQKAIAKLELLHMNKLAAYLRQPNFSSNNQLCIVAILSIWHLILYQHYLQLLGIQMLHHLHNTFSS